MKDTFSVEFLRAAPPLAATTYLNFVSDYGAAIVTTLTILYVLLGVILRVLEFRKNKEKTE